MFDLTAAVIATLACTWILLAAAACAQRLAMAIAEENPPRWAVR